MPAAISRDAIIAQRDGIVGSLAHGDFIGVHIDNGLCYGFNKTATRVWTLIEEPTTFGAVCDALVERFDVDPADCEAQVARLIGEWREHNLVDVDTAA